MKILGIVWTLAVAGCGTRSETATEAIPAEPMEQCVMVQVTGSVVDVARNCTSKEWKRIGCQVTGPPPIELVCVKDTASGKIYRATAIPLGARFVPCDDDLARATATATECP